MLTTTLTLEAENSVHSTQNKVKKIHFGQTIFRKKLQRKCGYTAGHWAQQHTKKEWDTYQSNGTFKNELASMCPKGIKVVKDKWMEPLYLFASEYAKDTGKRPRC
jgi:hypothetical protein